jgi:subtilisin family serine protease
MNFLPRFLALLFLAPITLPAQPANAWRHKIAPEVRAALDRGASSDVLVCFREKADLRGASTHTDKKARTRFVYEALLQTAARTQTRALALARAENAGANTLFLVNALAVDQASPELLRRLAKLPEVEAISPDPWIEMPPPVREIATGQRNSIEWGVERINAPTVWTMGYTGQGVTVGGADTGYDWLHPAILPHYRGYNTATGSANHQYNWHDAIHELNPLNGDANNDPLNNPCGLNAPAPCDDHNHGTHTAGTMTGDDGQGNQIGVAPGASWIGCRNMERGWGRPSSYLECFQWFLAPTDLNNENADPDKAPDVINNSWYCADIEGCTDLTVNELLRQAVIALKSAGVFVVVSNGNAGSNCASTDGPPAYFEESFSIGATRPNDTIAGFSSRGPVLIDNSLRTKPNVTAPGQNVRSCIRNGEYASFSGTSMAGPHVAGLVALVLSAQPLLAGQVEALETIIEETAIPTIGLADCSDANGTAYPNNTYGFGRVDALAAVNLALAWSPPSNTINQSPPAALRIFPNPADDQLFLELQHGQALHQIECFSPEGRLMFRTALQAPAEQETIRINTRDWPAGMYLLRLSGNEETLSRKFFKN